MAVEGDPKRGDDDGNRNSLYAVGSRSFTIRDAPIGAVVFDSLDNRSHNKGPEPEGLAVGRVDGAPYLWLGLERIGGVMVDDLSDPAAPLFVDCANNRFFPVDACSRFELGEAGEEVCVSPGSACPEEQSILESG